MRARISLTIKFWKVEGWHGALGARRGGGCAYLEEPEDSCADGDETIASETTPTRIQTTSELPLPLLPPPPPLPPSPLVVVVGGCVGSVVSMCGSARRNENKRELRLCVRVKCRLGLGTGSRDRTRTQTFAVEHVDFHARLDLFAVFALPKIAAEIGGPRAQARDAHCAVVAGQFAHRIAVGVSLIVAVRVLLVPRAAHQQLHIQSQVCES